MGVAGARRKNEKKKREKELRNGNSVICSSSLKYGYSEFSLEILEYCLPDVLIEREQFYLDNFNPTYNILKVAGSSMGMKHSEATKFKKV